ncbi:hypothetical protein B0H10DRAFT_2240520 [Mycena sp. CBHHK59/15]|nr:hypothetical protein B0H10DRAFT_2240520 [Mycena sp. CBHHK59/15]
MSRIDWVLVSPTLMKNCHGWEISDFSGSLTDHKMVSVRISAPEAPYIGKGRWVMPNFLLYDTEFMNYAMEEACKLEDSMGVTRTETANAQTRFKDFKDSVLEFAKKRAKTAKGSRRSSEMAEIARDYHSDLQADGIDIAQELWDEAKQEALDALPPLREEADMKPLAEKLTEDNVLKALLEAAPRKAAGINGYATEFWRRLEAINKENPSP